MRHGRQPSGRRRSAIGCAPSSDFVQDCAEQEPTQERDPRKGGEQSEADEEDRLNRQDAISERLLWLTMGVNCIRRVYVLKRHGRLPVYAVAPSRAGAYAAPRTVICSICDSSDDVRRAGCRRAAMSQAESAAASLNA